ncbi:AraC family transcriptional regulator [Pseudocolwellia sp. AS88]|jgi:AraC-like DNA-binding protein|uniref:AraC family transcriptional regulator n=1 Tax=Pseudocolwellia sp. AS88 TaxID=3063958 RepID=UPI0026F08261|nr:AraC family transcriptional regulator [Pseudocolwellia sp. AS88]MDO7084200.1 AraC family transcriptional regulator [Pseudocolwellia sp. AS88]
MAALKERAEFQLTEELGGIELLDATYYKQNFSRHSHAGYTVGVIDNGAQKFYRTGDNHIAPQHSIILVNADEVHNGCSASEGGWSYRAMYPLPAVFESISQELGLNKGAPYFPQAVVYDPHLAQVLRTTFTTLSTSENTLLRESVLYSALVKLVARHSKSRFNINLAQSNKSHVLLVKEFLDEYPAADVSLEELALISGLSPCHLLRQFQRSFGLPPHTYQIQSRLRLAKKLIQQGYKMMDVALDSGFHDQSHLYRHFKRAMGVTPGVYSKALRANFVQ